MTQDKHTPDEFYVGYLPVPRNYLRFLKRLVPLLILTSVAFGAIAIRQHNNPGTGIWKDDSIQEFEGVIDTTPCAMLRIADPDKKHTLQTILLVSEGKFGAKPRAEPFQGRAVRVRGTELSREGRRMIELAEGEDAITPADDLSISKAKSLGRPIAERIGTFSLRGEIIDPKCYFGAMKPGEGKAHKECATLCISGGIPPMFITKDAIGKTTYYLLADMNGEAVGEAILPYVADPVELSGEVDQLGDILLFRIDPGKIKRI